MSLFPLGSLLKSRLLSVSHAHKLHAYWFERTSRAAQLTCTNPVVALLQYTLLKSTPSKPCRQKGQSTQRPGRFTPGKDTVRNVQKAGWASRPIWMGEENLAPTGVRSLNRPAHSVSYPHTQLKYASYHNIPYATKYHIVSAFVKIYVYLSN
jgi:hypothetical protein